MRNKKMKKNVIAILTATVILLSSLGPLLSIYTAQAADPASWYKTIPGNLDSDTYALYPFAAKSLTIGHSQFGELLDGNTKTGLEYDGTDPFGPNTDSPPEYQWIEGWILNVTYVQGGLYRNVWAMAIYSDYYGPEGIGGAWHENVTVGSLDLSVRGGRKTSGGAVTDPIIVLYDSPRRYVGMTKTTIYDSPAHTLGLLTLTFYFDFNKVKKEVVIIKDVKRIDIGKNIGNMQIEFGDRGEWDLGAGSPPKSYAHFYMGEDTVYDENWQPWYANGTIPVQGYTGKYDVCQIIDDEANYVGWAAFWPKPITSWVGATQEEADRPTIMTSITTITEDQLGTGTERNFTIGLGNPVAIPKNSSSGIHWYEDPMVFVDGTHRTVVSAISDPARQVTYDRVTNTVIFPVGYAPAEDAVVRMVYKVDTSKTDMSSEPNSPFVIGEWAFEMHEAPSQFRGVTVYGLGDVHNGFDAQMEEGRNTIDREAQYQLDEVFTPWDLYQAIEKKTSRWVEYYNATTYDYVYLDHRPVIDVTDEEWDQYGMFTERIEDLNDSVLLHRIDDDPVAGETYDYTFSVDSDGYALVDGLELDHMYKILYSTYTEIEYTGGVDIVDETWINETISASTILSEEVYDYASWTDILNVDHEVSVSADIEVKNMTAITGATNHTFTYTWDFNPWASDFKVFKESETELGVWDIDLLPMNVTSGGNVTQFTVTNVEFEWDIYPPELTDVHVDWMDADLILTLTVDYNATINMFDVNWYVHAEPWSEYDYILYAEHIPGRYEWGIVGRDAASVDSAGLSLVSAAFKNKQVEYGLAGEDMYDTVVYNQMPWVMNKIGTATEVLHTYNNYYYYNYGEGYANDYRVALRDDWCTTWPVSSSNMIAVGGPIANMLSYYENDFSDAFAGLGQFTSDAIWSNKIVAKTCWMPHSAAHAYESNNTVGYGVVTSYLDINGTAVLQLWGYWGRDTYYLTKWFHEYGIYQLQEAPSGLTSIIVKINYKSYPEGYKPTAYSIVECLGTISERLWIHNSEHKGGIHDP